MTDLSHAYVPVEDDTLTRLESYLNDPANWPVEYPNTIKSIIAEVRASRKIVNSARWLVKYMRNARLRGEPSRFPLEIETAWAHLAETLNDT